MNKILSLAFAAAFVAFGAVSANAQESKPLGLTLRAGLFWPSERYTRDRSSEQWFAFGVEYKLPGLKQPAVMAKYGGDFSISLDYFNKSDFSNVPVLLNYTGKMNQLYYVVGAGVGFTKKEKPLGGTQSNTSFAYQLGVGYEFSTKTPVFAELKYIGSTQTKLAGFGVFGGVRF